MYGSYDDALCKHIACESSHIGRPCGCDNELEFLTALSYISFI